MWADPPGRAGGLDGELAYLLGSALGKRMLFTGGALDRTGPGEPTDVGVVLPGPLADGWTALL